MDQENFVFTSGCESVLDESMDYGIKRIDPAIPRECLESLARFCDRHIEVLSTARNTGPLVILGKKRGNIKAAIIIQITTARDHVHRENFRAAGKMLYTSLSAYSLSWSFAASSIDRAILENWLQQDTTGQEQKILRMLGGRPWKQVIIGVLVILLLWAMSGL